MDLLGMSFLPDAARFLSEISFNQVCQFFFLTIVDNQIGMAYYLHDKTVFPSAKKFIFRAN